MASFDDFKDAGDSSSNHVPHRQNGAEDLKNHMGGESDAGPILASDRMDVSDSTTLGPDDALNPPSQPHSIGEQSVANVLHPPNESPSSHSRSPLQDSQNVLNSAHSVPPLSPSKNLYLGYSLPNLGVYQPGVLVSQPFTPSKEVDANPEDMLVQLSNHITPQMPLYIPQSQSKIHEYEKDVEDGPEIPFVECSGGVIYEKGSLYNGARWLVFWFNKGRIWRKSYSVQMYGNEGAKELAESFWVNKMRAIQLSNRCKQERLTNADLTNNSNAKGAQSSPSTHLIFPMEIPEPETLVSNDDLDVFWDAESRSWCFERLDPETMKLDSVRIPSADTDDLDAKAEAIRQKNAYYQEFVRKYGESNYSGLTYEKTRCCWRVAYWIPMKKIKRNKYFNVSKYGYKIAKEAAIQYRITVEELKGEEPQNFQPELLPTQEFLNDPITLHYHHILNSFRSKETKLKLNNITSFTHIVNNLLDHDNTLP